jgi:hypothetical protein
MAPCGAAPTECEPVRWLGAPAGRTPPDVRGDAEVRDPSGSWGGPLRVRSHG